ncbi:pyruvate kinase [Desulfovibrio aminophilus]|nr:pyruvate kinase [Desulfovibrio aminophilus]MCM0753703.1 pyruvate kinase [Desulfovibrio aminophilus]
MRTKIVATVGPSTKEPSILRALVDAGVRIFRLNFSHSDAKSFVRVIRAIRKVERETDLSLTVLADLSGPKLRIGEVAGSPLNVEKGGIAILGLPGRAKEAPAGAAFIPLDRPELLAGLAEGMPVNLSDGMLQFHVSRVLAQDELFELTAANPGLLTSHKGIVFPGKSIVIPALTDKDRTDIHEALDVGIDAAALSFVQTAQDVLDLKAEIEARRRWIPIVVKLERQQAVDNLESILDVADGVMVARGDLGQECPLSKLPIIQKQIIRACRMRDKPVIVATQMLLSMVSNPVPTRAETTDVANAILDGADCVMLSEETAIGRWPVETVRAMRDIAEQAEGYALSQAGGPALPEREGDPERTLAYCACLLAEQTAAHHLVCHTRSGTTAQRVSGRRPRQPIHALTPSREALSLLNFSWGVIPHLVGRKPDSHLGRCQQFVDRSPLVASGESVVITAGEPTPGRRDLHTNQVKVYYK